MISTLAELKSSITNWSHRGDLSLFLDDIVLTAEKWIFRRARTRDMEVALSLTIANGVATVPTDYVALKHARIDGTPTQALQMKAADWIYSAYPDRSSGEKPLYIAIDGANFIFGPEPDANYSVVGIYYKRLTSLLTATNDLFLDNPDLYLFACLAELEPFLKNDKRIVVWQQKRQQILEDMNSEDTGGLYSGPLTMETYIPAARHR